MRMLGLALVLSTAMSSARAASPPLAPEGPSVGSSAWADPRTDPAWLARDRRLTRGVIGTGVWMGAMGLGLLVSLAVGYAPVRSCPEQGCAREGNLAAAFSSMVFGGLTAVSVVTFAVVAGSRHEHREPLRRWQAGLSSGGVVIRF